MSNKAFVGVFIYFAIVLTGTVAVTSWEVEQCLAVAGIALFFPMVVLSIPAGWRIWTLVGMIPVTILVLLLADGVFEFGFSWWLGSVVNTAIDCLFYAAIPLVVLAFLLREPIKQAIYRYLAERAKRQGTKLHSGPPKVEVTKESHEQRVKRFKARVSAVVILSGLTIVIFDIIPWAFVTSWHLLPVLLAGGALALCLALLTRERGQGRYFLWRHH